MKTPTRNRKSRDAHRPRSTFHGLATAGAVTVAAASVVIGSAGVANAAGPYEISSMNWGGSYHFQVDPDPTALDGPQFFGATPGPTSFTITPDFTQDDVSGTLDVSLYGPVAVSDSNQDCSGVDASQYYAAAKQDLDPIPLGFSNPIFVSGRTMPGAPTPTGPGCFAWGAHMELDSGGTADYAPNQDTSLRVVRPVFAASPTATVAVPGTVVNNDVSVSNMGKAGGYLTSWLLGPLPPNDSGTCDGVQFDFDPTNPGLMFGQTSTDGTQGYSNEWGTADGDYQVSRLGGDEPITEEGCYAFATKLALGSVGSHTEIGTPFQVADEPPVEPTEATPAEVTFQEQCGTDDDTYTIPETEGIDYLVDGEVVDAGTYPGTGDVDVTAQAQDGYTIPDDATTEWSHTFDDTACPVEDTPATPAEVTFADACGTDDDTYTIPETEGIDYLVDGKVVDAGTYPGTGDVTVTAQAQDGYTIPDDATTEWSHTFDDTACPVEPTEVVPTEVTFSEFCGTDGDQYTIPETEGVDYLVDGEVVDAGTYPGTGDVTVTAQAQDGYVLADDATTEWSHSFDDNPCVVPPTEATPAEVTFADACGTDEDTYTIPETEGIDYLVDGEVVDAGTYPGTGDVDVTAQAVDGYVLADDATTEWSHTFDDTACTDDSSEPTPSDTAEPTQPSATDTTTPTETQPGTSEPTQTNQAEVPTAVDAGGGNGGSSGTALVAGGIALIAAAGGALALGRHRRSSGNHA